MICRTKSAILAAVTMLLLVLGSDQLRAQTVKSYFSDLPGFNAAAGSPSVLIDFDNISAGTDITSTTTSGVTFSLGNSPIPSAPLIVVRGADTFTPAGFQNVVNSSTNKLFPTSGDNVLSPGGTSLSPGPNPLVENDDLLMTFNPPVSAVGFDVLFQELDCCSMVAITVLDPLGNHIFSTSLMPTGYLGPGSGGGGPGGSTFVGLVASSPTIAKIIINEYDGDDYFPDSNIGVDSIRFTRTSTFTSFFGNLEEFNRIGGDPPRTIAFYDFQPGTEITGATLGGVTFNAPTTGPPTAPLIVVRADDTYTPAGFQHTSNTSLNQLHATSGANILSPGGAQLAPGPNPLLENDDLDLTFNPPVSSVGFDILFQEFDRFLRTSITVYDTAGHELFSTAQIPSTFIGDGDGGGAPGGSMFVGFVSSVPNIARIVIDEQDDDDYLPDSNIGYDSFRLKRAPTAASIDVLPGLYPNLVNFNSTIPVVFYSSQFFDATSLDASTITMTGPNFILPWRTTSQLCQPIDADLDGRLDLVCRIAANERTVTPGPTGIIVEGSTISGTRIRAVESLVIPVRRTPVAVQPAMEEVLPGEVP